MFPRVSFSSFFSFSFTGYQGKRRFWTTTTRNSFLYIRVRFDLYSFSMCSAQLERNVHARSELGKAHDPLDLSNSRETVGKEVSREVYFAYRNFVNKLTSGCLSKTVSRIRSRIKRPSGNLCQLSLSIRNFEQRSTFDAPSATVLLEIPRKWM